MAEPQPSNVHEGMDPEDATHPAPTNAEDRKAAAALSSLDTRGEDDDAGKKLKKEDQDALGKAISRLEAGTGKGPEGSQVKKDQEKKEEEVKKKVKVDQKDVTLLVQELELNKIKATELLKAHDGDVIKAVRAFVSPSA